MPLDPDFVADAPYLPGGLLLDEILEIDVAASLVRARMPTSADLPLTREQRADPVRHPCHVSGGLMMHMTGMMGFAHGYYVLGLRHKDGWIGYGTRVHSARFPSLATVDEPLELSIRATQVRRIAGKMFARYSIKFTQGGRTVFDGDQSAIWTKIG